MWRLSSKGASGFSSSSTAEEVTQGIDGSGLTAIVTGASSGIGTETARVLALRGVHVVMAVRNMAACREVKEAIVKEIPNAKVQAMELDLSSLASVGKFASQFKSSGHFLLTNLLLETSEKTARESSKEGRIVNVSSRRHQFSYPEGIRFNKINDWLGYNRFSAYGQSKLANVLHTNELARHLKEDGVEITANSVQPRGNYHQSFPPYQFFQWYQRLVGLLGKYVIKNVEQGAATTCYVALHPQVKGFTGSYFADSNVAQASSQAVNTELAHKLWDLIYRCSQTS